MDDKIKQDQTDYGALRGNLISDIKETYIVDQMIIKGVSPNREENQSNFDYNLHKEQEDDGYRFYLHKYFTGHEYYYLHCAY